MSKYVIYKLENQGEECWHWRLEDDQGVVVAESEESFLKGSIVPSIKRIREEATKAPVWEDESQDDQDKGYRFEYSRNQSDNQCAWRLRAGNHQTMAVGHVSVSNAETDLENIKSTMSCAEIRWDNPEDDPAHQDKSDDRTETKGIPGS